MTYDEAKKFLGSLLRKYQKFGGVEHVCLPFDQFLALEILAHQGAKVIPRPIKDVPKDSMFIYLVPRRDGVGVGMTYPNVSGCNSEVHPSYADGNATHGMSLNDLPKVK